MTTERSTSDHKEMIGVLGGPKQTTNNGIEKGGHRLMELEFIEWLKQRTQESNSSVRGALPCQSIGIGDDGALQTLDKRDLVSVADMLLEGTHFDLEKCSPYEVGRKALAVNLSDMAAMGAEPKGGLVSIGLPRQSSASFAEAVMTGVFDLAKKFSVAIVGGDTNVWSGGLIVAVTVYGEPMFNEVITRRGAEVGNWIMVTGSLGRSYNSVDPSKQQPPSDIPSPYVKPWSGAHHLWFEPRLHTVRELLTTYKVTGMIDLSDGLATDLKHLLKASKVGATLQTDLLPCRSRISSVSTVESASPISRKSLGLESANQDISTEDLIAAVSDGEDFELCFTIAASEGQALLARGLPVSQTAITKIGTIDEGTAVIWQGPFSDVLQDLSGYEHSIR